MKQRPRFTPHTQSAPGDFYTANGACGSCGVPQAVAPDLIAWTTAEHYFWVKQPETPEELTRAIAVLQMQELGCHRYAGRDPEILKRISPENCDYPLKSANSGLGSPATSRPYQIAPLDHGTGLISKIWKRITGA